MYSRREEHYFLNFFFVSLFALILVVNKTSVNFDHILGNSLGKSIEEKITAKGPIYYRCRNTYPDFKLKFLNEKYDETIIKRHPNLPKFLTERRTVSSSIPDIPSIRWNGKAFQESWKESPKFNLYSAHFDTRLGPDLYIHLLALYDGEEKANYSLVIGNFCQIWFSTDENPIIVPVYDSRKIENFPNAEVQLKPYILSCKVPKLENNSSSFPVAVSLVRQKCRTPTNILKVYGSPKKKKRIVSKDITVGICGKALFYYNEDFSIRLIEWIEILKLLRVSKIFLYQTTCHENVRKVLDFYEEEGIVKLITFSYPPPYVQEETFLRLWTKSKLWAYRSAQDIYINDCLLRNKDDFDYLGVFDCDELPILKQHHSLKDFLKQQRMKSGTRPESYFLKWKTFFKDIKSENTTLKEEDHSYIFSHNIRTKLDAKEANTFETNGKTFHDTNDFVLANPHKRVKTLAGKVRLKILPRQVAYVGHFTTHDCSVKENCIDGNMEAETVLHPIREKVVREMNKVLNILKIKT